MPKKNLKVWDFQLQNNMILSKSCAAGGGFHNNDITSATCTRAHLKTIQTTRDIIFSLHGPVQLCIQHTGWAANGHKEQSIQLNAVLSTG